MNAGIHGRKEVGEAVAIAALTALCTGLINFGIKKLEEATKKKDDKDSKGTK